jgi:hypothetical protein
VWVSSYAHGQTGYQGPPDGAQQHPAAGPEEVKIIRYLFIIFTLFMVNSAAETSISHTKCSHDSNKQIIGALPIGQSLAYIAKHPDQSRAQY